ncbi:hypothetical protein FE257_006434 [Aspergillus nanangensis]|uniref:AB hydrolase-1 domain-containing protein n=1 Tax=Aspergillus nanangensis TaxID=2582783 RepID=A0AAD4CXK2_ASPNN|nr:hypothetical protein FE257_006434 [Aspergillus nanangensis]
MASIAFPSLAKKATLTDGTTYGYVCVRPQSPSKPTFLLLHGYPSSCFDWRHQIAGLQELGYGVIAPDLLGYGDTDKPTDLAAYRLKAMCAHMVEILDIEDISRSIAVGHDWGSTLASRLATYQHHRFYGIVSIGVGYFPPDGTRDMGPLADIIGYMKWHNTEQAIADANEHPASVFSLIYPEDPLVFKNVLIPHDKAAEFVRAGTVLPLPPWYSLAEYTVRDRIFSKDGYAGPLCWYRTAMRGFNPPDEAAVKDEDKACPLPLLFIAADKDHVSVAEMMIAATQASVPDLRIERLDTGHWVQLEKPEEVTRLIVRFAEEVVV